MTLARDLFSPFVSEGKVDKRLLRVLGLDEADDYTGSFDKAPDADDASHFDFHLAARTGRRIFFALKSPGESFGACDDDVLHRAKLKERYAPDLTGHVDAKWLDPKVFFENCEVLSDLSYLGRYPDSGIAFIFPRASEALMKTDAVIKQVVSKSLAPRVAILYLEYLVERILAAVADDESLRRHYLALRDRYIGSLAA